MKLHWTLLGLALVSCVQPGSQPPEGPPAASVASEVTVTGTFHIIWNSRPHYFVTDSAGVTTELLLSEEVTQPHGGPLQLIGKRVRVRGQRVDDPRNAIRAASVELQP